MDSVSASDLASCIDSVNTIHNGLATSSLHHREANDAVANIMSGWGLYFYAPHDLAAMVEKAVEIGYLSAMDDAHEGRIEGITPEQ